MPYSYPSRLGKRRRTGYTQSYAAPSTRRRRLGKGLRTFARARRSHPASQWGYQFIPRTAETSDALGSSYYGATAEQRARRVAMNYYGQGKYGLLKKAWSAARPIVSAMGKAALATGRNAALGAISSYAGSGMYTGDGSYLANELVDGANSDMIPSFVSKDDETGELTLSHREYVGEVYANEAGSAFENRTFPLNPGLESTFPWLSQIAQNFEEYDFKQLMFTYRSTVADVSSANGQVGTVIMATQYNPSRPSFRDKAEMIEYSAASSGKTTEGSVHGVECDNDKLSGSHQKYVRASHLENREDIKEYDHGTFQLATANTPVAFQDNSIGELWVSYTVCLRKPKLFSARGNNITRMMLHSSTITGTMVEANNLIPTSHRFPTAVTDDIAIASQSSFTPKLERSASKWKLVLPGNLAGLYRVSIRARGRTADSSGAAAIGLPYLGGNIRPVFSFLCGGAKAGTNSLQFDAPEWYVQSVAQQIGGAVHQFMLEFDIEISPASRNVDNALVWSVAAADASLGEVSHYYGSGSNEDKGPFDGTLNTTALFWEAGRSTSNSIPDLNFDLNGITIEMLEIGTGLRQARADLDYPELTSVSTGALVSITL